MRPATWSRPPANRRIIALCFSASLLLLLSFSEPVDPEPVPQPHRLQSRNLNPAVVGTYVQPSGSGLSLLTLQPGGEFLLIHSPGLADAAPSSSSGAYSATATSVALLVDPEGRKTASISNRRQSFVVAQWGCCRLLVPTAEMDAFCRAAAAGCHSPDYRALEHSLFRSASCKGQHLAGELTAPAPWNLQVPSHPIDARITFTTWANVARIDSGEIAGVAVGMRFFSMLSDGNVQVYRVVNVYPASSDVLELDAAPGWTKQRIGAILSTAYPRLRQARTGGA